jgi:predicted membrane protein
VLGEVIERGVGEVGFVVPMVIVRGAEAVFPVASVTAKVNVLVPVPVGVPDKRPD